MVIGANDTTAFLQTTLGTTNETYISAIEAAYPLGQNGIETDFDQIAAIATDITFTCPEAWVANDSASVNIPSWRYYFNATFINTQLYPGLGVYHSSEIQLVFSTYPAVNVTTQEYALSTSMRGAWARFAKYPAGGPGWNAVGTGGPVLVLGGSPPVFGGTQGTEVGGGYTDADGNIIKGNWDLGVFGNRHDAFSSGVTVVDQSEVDYRCALFPKVFLTVAPAS